MNWFGNFCILFLACVISVDMEFELLQRELFESTLDKITWEWYNMSMSNECGFISRLNLKINSLTMIPRHGNPQEQEYQHQILWNKRLNQMFWRSKKSPQICWHNIYQVTKNEVIHRFKSSAQKHKNLVIFSVFVCNRCNDNGEHQRHWNVCNSIVSYPTRWSLYSSLDFCGDHLSWQWRPHIAGCKMFLTLLRAELAVLTHFFCKIYQWYMWGRAFFSST